MEHAVLTDIAICIVVAWLFGVVAQVLRQPVLLAYLVAGYTIGPSGFGFVAGNSVGDIAAIGLILLLFIIGLEIDLKRVLGSGRAILATGLVQILGTFGLGLLFFRWLGFPLGGGKFDALYLAVGVFVSSTVIAVKILTDKRELDTLAGRISIGLSVIQDIAVIIFLGLQPALSDPSIRIVVQTFLKIGVLIGVALGASRYILPTLFRRVATLPELVAVGALAWCFLIAALAHALGLSREMGALVAGTAISTFPYHLDVAAKITSLRDFFITLFFVGLGLTIPSLEAGPVGVALAISAFVIVTRILTVAVPLRISGMGNRVGLLTALNLLPLSEFALVIASLGIEAGQVDRSIFAPLVYAFFILATLGSYAINASATLHLRLEPWLQRLGLGDRRVFQEARDAEGPRPDIFLLGFSWTASSLLEELTRNEPALLPRLAVIDFNPEVHRALKARGIHAIWGDITQRDVLEQAGLRRATLVLCTLPDIVLRGSNNRRLVQLVRSLNPDAAVVAHAQLLSDVPVLRAAGATHVHATRLHEADELRDLIAAADKKLIADKFTRLSQRLEGRSEVIP